MSFLKLDAMKGRSSPDIEHEDTNHRMLSLAGHMESVDFEALDFISLCIALRYR